MFADIIVDIPTEELDRIFQYRIPEEMEGKIAVGTKVLVPFGRASRPVEGYVTGIRETCDYDLSKIKNIAAVCEDQMAAEGKLTALAAWMKEQYGGTMLQALKTVLPVRKKENEKCTRTLRLLLQKEEGQARLGEYLHKNQKARARLLALLLDEPVLDYDKARKEGKITLQVVRDLEAQGVLAIESRRVYRSPLAFMLPSGAGEETCEKYSKGVEETTDEKKDPGAEADGEKLSSGAKKVCERKCPGEERPVEPGRDAETEEAAETGRAAEPEGAAETGRDDEPERFDEAGEPGGGVEKTADAGSFTEEQRQVLRRFQEDYAAGVRKTYLLHGVTGSGKTEVYMEMIRTVTAQGKQAIVLIPEIALTYQTVLRFYKHFGDRIAVLNSRLSAGERYDQITRAKNGDADVMIGPRSALFAPFLNLGLIVIDEEHDSAYKSEQVPRYHARETAVHRAQTEGASVVLGSATPSLEAMYRAKQGEYELLELKKRVHRQQMPLVHTVDMREELKNGNRSIFSDLLREKIRKRLSKHEQVMLFLNRRGYAGFVSCRACGHVVNCPHCSVSLSVHKTGRTGHGMRVISGGHSVLQTSGAAGEKQPAAGRSVSGEKGMAAGRSVSGPEQPAAGRSVSGETSRGEGTLICHYCGYTRPYVHACPDCGSPYIGEFRVGTQQTEELIRKEFPEARVLRMDLDTTRAKGSYERILSAFANHEADILVGTQMIVKGHDYPDVTLVGALAADLSLHANDYRAAERTFQLLTQAAGRAGRGSSPGEAVIQTYDPEHYAVKAAASQDYDAFYAEEMHYRTLLGYPPAGNMLCIRVSCADEELLEKACGYLKKFMLKIQGKASFTVIGPAHPGVDRVKDVYRRMIYVKSPSYAVLTGIKDRLERYIAANTGFDPVGILFDFNPMNM